MTSNICLVSNLHKHISFKWTFPLNGKWNIDTSFVCLSDLVLCGKKGTIDAYEYVV